MAEPRSPNQGALAFARSRGWFSTLDVQALLDAAGDGPAHPGPTAFAAALVEGALLVASADRALERPELDALAGLLQALTGQAGDRDELAGVVYAFAALARKQGRPARLLALARGLSHEENRHDVLTFSALVALCHKGLSDTEREALAAITNALGLPPAALDDAVAHAEAALAAG